MKKVAIVGFADTYDQAPFEDPSIMIYGLNELHKYLPRWDWWLEIHDKETLGLTKREGFSSEEVERHRQWLQSQTPDKGTIWMREDVVSDAFPASKAYPLARVQRVFGRLLGREQWTYFTSSISYMVAHVLTLGRDDDLRVIDENEAVGWIGLYGVDLAGDDEYVAQRPCAECFIGMALGLGIKLDIAKGAGILSGSHMYGYERAPKQQGPINVNILASRERRLTKTLRDLQRQAKVVEGALGETKNYRTLLNGSDRGMHVPPAGFLDDE